MIEATYISVMRDGLMWFQPAIVDAELNILWRGDVLVRTPRRAIKTSEGGTVNRKRTGLRGFGVFRATQFTWRCCVCRNRHFGKQQAQRCCK